LHTGVAHERDGARSRYGAGDRRIEHRVRKSPSAQLGGRPSAILLAGLHEALAPISGGQGSAASSPPTRPGSVRAKGRHRTRPSPSSLGARSPTKGSVVPALPGPGSGSPTWIFIVLGAAATVALLTPLVRRSGALRPVHAPAALPPGPIDAAGTAVAYRGNERYAAPALAAGVAVLPREPEEEVRGGREAAVVPPVAPADDPVAAYRRADEMGDPTAASNLGVLLEEQGDTEGALAAYRRAAERGDANGAFNLGGLLAQRGDLAGAIAAFRRADERGDGAGASSLGVILERQGDVDGAIAAYRRADERDDVNGAFNLGGMLAERGDMPGAYVAYQHADQRGDAAAASNLGVLLEQQGNLDGALAAYRRADQRGDANGAFNLGVLLAQSGDPSGAQAAYRRALERGKGQIADMASSALRELASQR
jgi:tetratricopeptide (TPR) repeat protein